MNNCADCRDQTTGGCMTCNPPVKTYVLGERYISDGNGGWTPLPYGAEAVPVAMCARCALLGRLACDCAGDIARVERERDALQAELDKLRTAEPLDDDDRARAWVRERINWRPWTPKEQSLDGDNPPPCVMCDALPAEDWPCPTCTLYQARLARASRERFSLREELHDLYAERGEARLPDTAPTDGAPTEVVLEALRACAQAWSPNARIIGNIRAGDIDSAIAVILARAGCEEETSKQCVQLIADVKDALGWAWIPCDQTIACPCCGLAWWDTPGDIADDWHAPGCEFQALLVRVGLSTGKRVAQGAAALDPRGNPLDAARVAREIAKLRAESERLRSAIKHMQSEVMLIIHNALDRQEGTPLERCREAHTLASRAYSIAQAAFEGLGEDEFDLRGSFSRGDDPPGRYELRKATQERLGTAASRGGPRYEDAEDETSDTLRLRLTRVEDVVRHALGKLVACPWCDTASAACRDGCPLTDIERALTGQEG